jgi:hypothetical protein
LISLFIIELGLSLCQNAFFVNFYIVHRLQATFLDLASVDEWLCSDSNVTGYVQFGLSLVPWLLGSTPAVVHDYVYAESGYYWENEVC